MTSFKSKFASLVSDLRDSKKAVYGKKFTEFTKQPQPAYSPEFVGVLPPPPPRLSTQDPTSQNTRPPPKSQTTGPPSRSNSIRTNLRKIGSRTSLRRKSSYSRESSSEIERTNVPHLPKSVRPDESTPPHSAEDISIPQSGERIEHDTNDVKYMPTPPSANDKAFDLGNDDDLYTDPLKPRIQTQSASHTSLPQLQTQLPSTLEPEAPMPPPPLPRMYIPRTNSGPLPTIPASPATTVGSPPVSPIGGTNPFRKLTPTTPNMSEVIDGPFKPASPESRADGFDIPRIDTADHSTETKSEAPRIVSPTTATLGLMQGIDYGFAPPPSPLPHSPITSSPILAPFADTNPFKNLVDDSASQSVSVARVKAIAPPKPITPHTSASSSSRQTTPPPPVPERTPANGAPIKQPQFKRPPTAPKTTTPKDFAPPPPPPMQLPKGWTARWDEQEQRFAYYQGTKGKDEQWEMPTEPAKKLSMRDRRLGKKKAMQESIARLPSYEEANSPTGSSSATQPATTNQYFPEKSMVAAGGSC